ncbi:valine--tRNA ligase [Candidatus Nomurabacteria bacterium RIFCSPHIGHO2_01_FULL_39_9]|uniref:Valine--tRNA ligase n=1 Tax=Candidatus Nomurabacteria bacterium RIFCSPHIGHO2_01_FULL_39_9 TaxID=1801735 RepID=A0A1F6UWE7_9BACT|nr:MAG: valine--tRNA ligase [Candidatus Nomurabacteria bacterium RIFCSPHIGHO2_01_FULL_39_9]
MIPEKFLKPYDPKETEERIYKLWSESGFFNPDNLPGDREKVFSIILPPPNVTGVLHMGHALTITTEDIMIRYHRMKGDKTLWLPGADHAAIATQSKVEKEIYKKENKSRYDLGREELLRRIVEFAEDSKKTIIEQTKKMGASIDWSRFAFTLDEKRSLAVKFAFKKMYEAGLIYRGYRIVNWDPKGATTISDDEIIYEERKTKLYTFKYSKDFPISISTTRPETKLGDTAVAVNPDDARYKNYVGKSYEINFTGVKLNIKIVADGAVDPEFGTGAVGVTPAHSFTDAEIGERHNLPMIQVINERARIMIDVPELKDKKITEAREIIIEWLKKENLLEKEEEITHNVALAERTNGLIEPLPKMQWFVAVNKEFNHQREGTTKKTTLKEIMRKPVETNAINIIPDHFKKTYFHWIDNLRDWCISRQIWYGHRIPVWYHEPKCVPIPGREDEISKCEELIVGFGDGEIKDCPHCGAKFIQDEDTLDTWFSSALWTFSTLGWPDKTKDLETYHPTNVLETGYEILFFWVARMVLMSGFFLNQIPFKTVYLHGTIRDSKGKKMSKSLGNAIDPLEMNEKYGTDAVRMSLIVGTAPGTDSKIDENKIKAYKHFANKIWNISRFVLENTEDLKENKITDEKDKELWQEFENLKKYATKDIEEFRFYLASEKIYHYLWHRFADIIIEESKPILKENNKNSRQALLVQILLDSIKILHPFMPFITEEVWQLLKKPNLLLIEKWPK